MPGNGPGKFSKTPENLPGLSRVIFKVTEDVAFEKKAPWLANFLAKSLKFVLELFFKVYFRISLYLKVRKRKKMS